MPNTNESEGFYLDISEPGQATVAFPNDEEQKTLNLAGTDLAKSCSSVNIFWSYPTGLLTLIIETAYTEKRQPYAIHIHNEQLSASISNVYRVIDNQKIEVTTTDKKIIFDSDSNYQVIVKFQGPPEMRTYGVNIHYDIIQK
ncbi:unnamed protein product [Rotaria sordida]|uniref:Uncharacterized protein n=1 Tax=Rotaria sordida TaxID=392033 RepID=A0A820ED53_9BILA|nr:unnamed protein product [Rotaria sordida]CAF1539944.1 unnamed protein product [Rotaria sordida]CAF4040578.1 unnamed protein product [Rotaria sordida]CAF4245013.1 unnamed protein product [Rotaria sordida]